MIDYNFHTLFGLPILIASIDPNSYDKQKLLDKINNNYKQKKIRQNWGDSNNFFQTDIHHSLQDEDNPLFEKIDYTDIIKNYNKPIETYLSKIIGSEKIKYNFKVVNYSAVKHNSFMKPHFHVDCDFAMVHYVSFDKEQHLPTIFLNPYFFSDFIPNNDCMRKVCISNNTNSSWIFGEWKHDIKEDDIIIFPSVLKHYVRNKDSDKLRVTISTNISIGKI
jgi:hypothetical protein